MSRSLGEFSSVAKLESYVERAKIDDDDLVERTPDIISVDDHIVEAAGDFTRRVPQRYADIAPRVVHLDDGDAWQVDGSLEPITSAEAFISWKTERTRGNVRVADMRLGAWNVDERVRDMDRDGVWASVLFPSMAFGFAGQRLSRIADPDAGIACVQAYNDWMYEDVVGAHPDRFVATQIVWFRDVDVAVAEIQRNAARGFKAVHFSENPEKLGYPSIHTGYWDPFFRACEETGTVLNLHLGSSSHRIQPSTDSPIKAVHGALTINPILAAFDWVYSEVGLRYPEIRIVLSEGGIDWVPMVISRLDAQADNNDLAGWSSKDLTPRQVMTRNFYFSALFDQAAFGFLGTLCGDRILLETDYPHGDSRWPHSHDHLDRVLVDIAPELVERFYFRNASELYRHPEPPRPASSS